MNLEICLKELKKEIKNYTFESNGVLETSEKLRLFWKPEKVKVLLLAESHVYTTEEENKILQNVDEYNDLFDSENYPKEFVKLIYCLGYGESKILDTSVENNSGTPQFWKIFYNTLNKIQDSDFSPVMVGVTKEYKERVKNKIKLLNEMKEKGIWLIDASILALYGNGSKPKDYKKILEICWHNYIRYMILKEKPEAILVIGKQVYDNLKEHLKTVNIPFDYIPQPQARLSKEEIQNTYKKTYDFVKKYIGENIILEHEEKQVEVLSTKENKIESNLKNRDTIKPKIETLTKEIKSGYKFNNQVYGKSRLVHAVVKKYLEDNPSISFSKLEEIFEKKLQGSIGVIKKVSEVKDKKRFFTSNEELLNISNENIVVCNQWDKNNIDKFINHVKNFGYKVEVIE